MGLFALSYELMGKKQLLGLFAVLWSNGLNDFVNDFIIITKCINHKFTIPRLSSREIWENFTVCFQKLLHTPRMMNVSLVFIWISDSSNQTTNPFFFVLISLNLFLVIWFCSWPIQLQLWITCSPQNPILRELCMIFDFRDVLILLVKIWFNFFHGFFSKLGF